MNIPLLPITPRLHLAALPAFTDNYIWLLVDLEQDHFWLVDPGDKQVLHTARSASFVTHDGETHTMEHWRLQGVLITHHHPDHTGALDTLIQHYPTFPIIGPKHARIPWVTHSIDQPETLQLLGRECHVMMVPGHTLDHIAYFLPSAAHGEPPILFCGDTLFAGGCGRLFEGSPAQMRQSLQKFRQLPQQTWVCCAHEYTEDNLNFAAAVSPNNPYVIERLQHVKKLRKRDVCTLPSRLGEELLTNPFLRWDSQEVICSATTFVDAQDTGEKALIAEKGKVFLITESQHLTEKLDADGVFRVIRSWKNNFQT